MPLGLQCEIDGIAASQVASTKKLKFHWDQSPRNFLADLLATSPTSS